MKREPRSYEDLREKWVHEDDLFNHRVTWLLLSQTLDSPVAGHYALVQAVIAETLKSSELDVETSSPPR